MTRFMGKQPKPTWDPPRVAPRCLCRRGPVKQDGRCDDCQREWLSSPTNAAAPARPHQAGKIGWNLATLLANQPRQWPRYLRELAHDRRGPFGVSDQEIARTWEYDSFRDRTLVWKWRYHVTEAEALLACRLMLRDLSVRTVDWYREAVNYVLEARRILAQQELAAQAPSPAAPPAGPTPTKPAPAPAQPVHTSVPAQGHSTEPEQIPIARHEDPGIPPLRDDRGVDLLHKARTLIERLRHLGDEAAAAQIAAILGDVVVLSGAVAAVLGGFYTGWQYVEGALTFDWAKDVIARRYLEYPRRLRRAEPDIETLERTLGELERAMAPHSDLVLDLSPPQPRHVLDIEPLRSHVDELERWMEPPGEARQPAQPSQPARDPDTEEPDRCTPRPACPHAGGDAVHNACADREPPNVHPGCDVEVDGRRFDALSPDRILWEIKTDDWSHYATYLQDILLRRYEALALADYRKAVSCGFGYRFAVADKALFEELKNSLSAGVAVYVPRCSRR